MNVALTSSQLCDCVGVQCQAATHDDLKLPAQGPAKYFSKETALYCGDLILRVLNAAAAGATVVLPPGVQLLQTLYDSPGSVFGVVCVNSLKQALVIFKGTTTKAEWKIDFGIRQTSSQQTSRQTKLKFVRPVPRFGAVPNIACALDVPIMVHSGFETAYGALRDQILSALASSSPTTVIVSGHSLGGGVANLCALDVAQNTSIKDVRLYTFASPKAGNPHFAVAQDVAGFTEFYQIQNRSDLIPTMPLAASPNVADRTHPFLYQHGGTSVQFDSNWGSVEQNHILPTYLYNISLM